MAGNFSGTQTKNTAGIVSSSTVSGTYVVAADGTLTLNPMDGSPITGGLSADGSRLVASKTTDGALPGVMVGIKQGQSNFSDLSLSGPITTIDFEYSGTGDISRLSTITFDGASNFSGRRTQNAAGRVSTSAVSGTYAVAANGTLTLSPTGGFQTAGGLSGDLNSLVVSQVTPGQLPVIVFGRAEFSSGAGSWDY